ncbi:hypothetical protein LCGC14_0915820 [marine sediment metagenome]|uniref:Uncharacterized protein n=1 Tax=marine sediment metagenome TaxID=412755 RepID=A0A0F9NSC3_9ZZZZ
MKCPLRFIGQELDVLRPPETRFICLKEGCAWWDEAAEKCAVAVIPRLLLTTGSILGQIHDRLRLSKYRYRCHDCGVTIERTIPGEFSTPGHWTRKEQVDGKHVWLCDLCSAKV